MCSSDLNIPGQTQTLALAIYNAVESGNGSVARTLVLVVSVMTIAILTLVGTLEKRVVR